MIVTIGSILLVVFQRMAGHWACCLPIETQHTNILFYFNSRFFPFSSFLLASQSTTHNHFSPLPLLSPFPVFRLLGDFNMDTLEICF